MELCVSLMEALHGSVYWPGCYFLRVPRNFPRSISYTHLYEQCKTLLSLSKIRVGVTVPFWFQKIMVRSSSNKTLLSLAFAFPSYSESVVSGLPNPRWPPDGHQEWEFALLSLAPPNGCVDRWSFDTVSLILACASFQQEKRIFNWGNAPITSSALWFLRAPCSTVHKAEAVTSISMPFIYLFCFAQQQPFSIYESKPVCQLEQHVSVSCLPALQQSQWVSSWEQRRGRGRPKVYGERWLFLQSGQITLQRDSGVFLWVQRKGQEKGFVV